MRPTHRTARAGESFGPYQLVRQLAVGGMAEIYLARATGPSGFEKFVALKMIHPNYAEDAHFIDMLVEEAKIVVHLTQPNIVQIFDLGRIGDVHYIAMEFVDGLDLYHVLRDITEVGELLDVDVAAFIALEICAALDYAHRCRDQLGRPLGIIHRDISPQNILLSKAGEVKLADFGIAKASVRARQTAVGVIKGKYYYMSPEQAWGDAVDHRTDIFSAGVVLYESIVGQMLYLDEDLGVLLDKVRRAEISPPSVLRPNVPRALDEIVLRAVARRPEDRFQSAHDFQLALQKFLWSHAPHFNLGKVREAVMRAVVLEDRKRVLELGGSGFAMSSASVPMQARPAGSISISFSSHSLLPAEAARTGERKLASLPDWGDDFGGATMVSDPPLMLAHLQPDLTGSPPPPTILPISVEVFGPAEGLALDVGWDEADETTTLVKGAARSAGPAGPAGLGTPPVAGSGHASPHQAPAPPGRSQPTQSGHGLPQGASYPVPGPQPGVPFAPVPLGTTPSQGPGPRPVNAPGAPLPGAARVASANAFGYGPPGPEWPPPQAGSSPPGPSLSPYAAQAPPPPAFQAAAPLAPSPWPPQGPEEEADAEEERMVQQRRRRLRILVGLGAGVLVLGLALIIFSARKSLEAPGSVMVESEPLGAKVFYKGREVGTTPYRLDSLPVDEDHSVRLEHPRCESTPARLSVEAGKTRTIRVKLRNCDN